MEYKVLLKSSTRYSAQYTYAVLCVDEEKDSILFTYRTQRTEKNTDLQKPVDFTITKAKTVLEVNKSENSYYSTEYKLLKGEPKDYNLYIPEFYNRKNIEIENKKHNELNEEMLKKFKAISNSYPFVLIGEDIERRQASTRYHRPDFYEYLCTKCGKTFYSKNEYSVNKCPHCDNSPRYNNIIISKAFKEHRNKHFDTNGYSSVTFSGTPLTTKERVYFMGKHPDNENGIILYKMCHEISAEKANVIDNYNIEYAIEHIVGEKMICNKYLKRSKKECDPFEALNINTKNIQEIPDILYENAETFLDFANDNEKFLRMSGFQAVLKYCSMNVKLEPFFIVFIGIVNKYPIMEQIIKMGHAKLFFDLYKKMLTSLNKNEISSHIEKLSEIVDNEAKKGKDALRFPPYIGDFLIKKDAQLEEYYYWRDLYEITHITKEQFENLTDSFNFAWVNSQVGLEDIGNILKFDYQVDKLLNYIVKQSRQKKINISQTINYLTDYLNMCDLTGIQPDKFPQDVKKVHDDMLIHYRNRKQIEYDKKLNLIGVECEKYVIPDEEELNNVGIPKLFETLTVVFPKSESDFINEGNQQHNCVGSYPNRVRNGSCVIFFIRYKNNPNKSFITAECTRSGLGQCFYSNNRMVNDENLVKFAKYIANKIKTGCNSGKIHGLNNI